MKILAIHDKYGNIEAVVVPPADGPTGAPVVPGLIVTEVDAPDMKIDTKDPGSSQKLLKMLQEYQVEVKTIAKLVKKTQGKASNPLT